MVSLSEIIVTCVIILLWVVSESIQINRRTPDCLSSKLDYDAVTAILAKLCIYFRPGQFKTIIIGIISNVIGSSPYVILVFYNRISFCVNNCHNIALKVMYIAVHCVIVLYKRRPALGIVEEMEFLFVSFYSQRDTSLATSTMNRSLSNNIQNSKDL